MTSGGEVALWHFFFVLWLPVTSRTSNHLITVIFVSISIIAVVEVPRQSYFSYFLVVFLSLHADVKQLNKPEKSSFSSYLSVIKMTILLPL